MNKDEAKGRMKEAAGDLSGDDELKRDKAGDKVKDALRKD